MGKIRKSDDEKNRLSRSIQEQYTNLFSGKDEPPTSMSISEVNALQARITELETELEEFKATQHSEAGGSEPVPAAAEPSAAVQKEIQNIATAQQPIGDQTGNAALSDSQIRRNMALFSTFLGGIALFAALFYFVLYLQTGVWQIVAESGFILLGVVMLGIAILFVRRNKFRAASTWIMLGISIAYASPEVVWKNATANLLITGMLLIFVIGTAFPPQAVTWFILPALYVAYMFAVDQIQPLPRFDVNQSPVLRIFIPGVTVLIGIWVVWQLVQTVARYSREEALLGSDAQPVRSEGKQLLNFRLSPFWRALSRLLLEPDKSVVGVEARRQSQFLTTLLSLLLPLFIFGELFRLTGQFDVHAFTSTLIALALIASYGLSRTSRFNTGTLLSVLALTAAIYQTILQPSGTGYTVIQFQGSIVWIALPLVLGSVILPLPWLVIYLLGNLIVMISSAFILSGFSPSVLLSPIVSTAIVSIVLVIGKRFREQVEQENRAELTTKNEELESSEKIAARRSQYLLLASEVSQRLSQIHDLSTVLTETVEIIRSNFDLYYVQVYLANPNQTALILQAGTGKVGAELLRRGHRLSIGLNSLNGRAAFEKRPVIVADTKESQNFLPNPLLPKTRSEMAVPLISGKTVLGVLDMQSERIGLLNADNLAVFETLAGQLAIAIQNATLFAETEEARAEVEAQVHRLTERGWQEYLDGIQRGQKMGYAFDQTNLVSLKADALSDVSPEAFNVPVSVTGINIGAFQLVWDADHTRTSDETELVHAAASQLAQHIENLRLLAQADRYRAEAEQAVSRLTHEGWKTYLQSRTAQTSGYVFDLTEIQPLDGKGYNASNHALRYPLVVREQAVGELAVDAGIQEAEAAVFIKAVAEHLSNHIENLRLSEQTERALIQTEELARQNDLILGTAGEGIFGLNDAGEHTFVNPAAAEMLGYSVEELNGRHSHSTWHHSRPNGSDYPDIECPIYSTLHDGGIHQGDEFFWRKNGSGFPVAFTSTPIREGDRIVGAVVTFRDITESKQAQEALRLAQERTQAILESVTLPMVITRLSDNCLTFVNQPATEIIQLKYDDVINKPAMDFYFDREERNRFINELRANGRVTNMTVQLVRGSREPFWALLSARIFNYQSEPSILTTFTDITERIRTQETIAQRAAQLETVAIVSTTTATLLDPDRLLQTVVDVTRERFGVYHAHIYLTDGSWRTLLLAAGAGEVGRKMVAEEHAIAFDTERSLVARAARERKAAIVNDVRTDPGFLPNPLLPDTRSEIAVPMIVGDQVIGVFDVQADKVNSFTDEDAHIYTTLASQVAVALQNARLYAEQAATVTQLRELDRLKSSFLANMSHELRTPLNSILGFSDVMIEEVDGPLTENMRNDLGLIQKNGQHLLHLINDVLDMAKIEAGRMNLNPERFKVHEILEEVVSITSPLASEKSLSLFIRDDSNREVDIVADRTRIRQVMLNLVNNAMKFTEKGKISLQAGSVDGHVLIEVKDTGIGIPPDKLEAIFQEFAQVDTSATRKVGGTGLGLPISRRLIEMHGGRLWAESTGQSGEGSIFFVELPREAVLAEPAEKLEK